MPTIIYMDYHATTPVDPEVLGAMLPYFTGSFGNAASRSHAFGWEAEAAVEIAREQVAALIGGTAREIVWTSGATESTNLALKGVAEAHGDRGRHVVTTAVDHAATLDTCRHLATQGFEVSCVPVDATGTVSVAAIEAALRPDTLLVSVIHGQNEIGTIQPVEAIGRLLKDRGVLYHVDAAQTFGKVPIDVVGMGIDLLSVSGHKIYGPKGVGALYVRRRAPRVRLAPQMHGGGQERGLRSGTLNVPGIVGLGKAAAIAASGMAEETVRIAALRDRLAQWLIGSLEGVIVHGHPTCRLAGNLNVSFTSVEADAVIGGLKHVALSSGSACSSGASAPSFVLRACGVSDALAHGAVRYGLGRFTTEAEVEAVARATIETVTRLRALSPLSERTP